MTRPSLSRSTLTRGALICALALGLAAGPALAQDLVFSHRATEQCFENGGWEEECVGASAAACMRDTPGGETTYGMGGCLNAELEYWDARLNAEYYQAMGRAEAFDADMAGSSAASVAGGLRDMQRAWIAFRDGKCGFEYAQWGGGTGGGPAMAECLMYATAKQTLYLQYALEP